jgi:hypothetical protein
MIICKEQGIKHILIVCLNMIYFSQDSLIKQAKNSKKSDSYCTTQFLFKPLRLK